MLRSMTGYGFASNDAGYYCVKVEIKTLNAKGQDLNIRLPKNFSDKEIELRNMLAQKLERGKVNLYTEVAYYESADPKLGINKAMVKKYYDDLKATAEYVGASAEDLLYHALKMPDVYQEQEDEDQRTKEWEVIINTVEEAVAQCEAFRQREGASLKEKLEKYIENINVSLQDIEKRDPERIDNIRNKVQSRVRELSESDDFDPNRFEQEMIYYIEKLDIAEEKQRLKTHLDHFTDTLNQSASHGKKLNFIAQEIGREINTIGSKANDADIQKMVIVMKEELEKIKEQVLNVL